MQEQSNGHNKSELSNFIVSTAQKFRTVPRSMFLEEVCDWIIENLKKEEVGPIFNFAINNFDYFPSIAQLRELKSKLKLGSNWKYFEVDDCLACGGVGWHWVLQKNPGERVKTGPVACNDCAAGKNLQIAPATSSNVKWTMRQCTNVEYLCPGTETPDYESPIPS